MSSRHHVPPTYVSSLCILEHIDPNLRFTLSHRCPSLESIEKSVPLRIKDLHIKPLELTMNDTCYQIGIIRKYHPKIPTPSEIACTNFLGGKKFDLDQYGFQVADVPVQEDPNEVSIDGRNFNKNRLKWRERWEKEKFEEMEDQLEKLKKERDLPTGEERRFFRIMDDRLTFVSIERRIEELEYQLLPFQLRRAQALPTFTHYIQLAISKGIERRCERLNYSGSVYEAMKYFIWKFFAGRNRNGFVMTKRIDMEFNGLIRLPKNLKIEAKMGNLEEEELELLGGVVEFC